MRSWALLLLFVIVQTQAQTNPPFMSLLNPPISGPQAYPVSDSRYNDSVMKVCVPHTRLRSAVVSVFTPILNDIHPTITVEMPYTGVLEAADLMFTVEAANMCDIMFDYSMALPRLVHDDILLPLNSFFTDYQHQFGYSPHNDMPPQSFNDLYFDGQWFGIPERFQNLALVGNLTTMAALGLTPPSPVGSVVLTWKTFAEYINKAYYDGKVEEPYLTEPCMVGQALIAFGTDLGVSLIAPDGTCGWRDPKFIDAFADIWVDKILRDKPYMFARMVDLGKGEIMNYMRTPSEQWPPERRVPIPRGTCSLANKAHFLTVLDISGKPEMQAMHSPGSTNTIQTWSYGITKASKKPELAWSFLSYMINCDNPKAINHTIDVTKAIPAFTHCIELPPIKAMIESSPNLRRTLGERRKSFPANHPKPPFPNLHQYEASSVPLILLMEAVKDGLYPLNNLTQFFPVPYNNLDSRWGKGGIVWPTSPMFDPHVAATRAVNRACAQLEYIQLPDCVHPTNTLYILGECDGDTAIAHIAWNTSDVDKRCIVTPFAAAKLKRIASDRVSKCPHIMWESSTGITYITFSAVGLLATAITTILWIVYRNLFGPSSVGLTLVLIAGIFMFFLAGIALVAGSCVAFMFFASMSIFTASGALFMKQYRLHKIFKSTRLKTKRHLEEWKMILGVVVIDAINLIMFIIWFVTRGDDTTLQSVEQFANDAPVVPVLQCNYGNTYVLIVWGLLFAILSLGTSRYGYRLRGLKGQFADSAFTAYANTITWIIVMVAVFMAALTGTSRALTTVLVFGTWFEGVMLLVSYFALRFIKLCDPNFDSDLSVLGDATTPRASDPKDMMSMSENGHTRNSNGSTTRKPSEAISVNVSM